MGWFTGILVNFYWHIGEILGMLCKKSGIVVVVLVLVAGFEICLSIVSVSCGFGWMMVVYFSQG